MEVQRLIAKRFFSDSNIEMRLKGEFLTEADFDTLITTDTDAYTAEGEMLFRFRKNALPLDVLKLGVDSFKDSIVPTEGRGTAAGKTFKRIRKDGSTANTTVSNFVESGNVGFMDASAMVRYCRKTAFARDYFEKFTAGIPFVKAVDDLYKELCPEHYERQLNIAQGTNRNYVIGDTTFTTVTVNRNFQTAVHKDSGDFMRGFGNLCVYREGDWGGSYFCLPEFRVAIDMQSTDMLFVDVHRWHGNTPFVGLKEGDIRIAFVMYYREYMINCKQPAEELQKTKMDQGGFLKL
jgi:hypothetical protein